MTERRYRRARKDYPEGVLAVYDNGGKTIDRYTVVYTPYNLDGGPVFPYVGMSSLPFHPQGYCQHGAAEGARPTGGGWAGQASCGRVIALKELPADCQQVVKRDLEAWEAEA